MKKRVRRGLYRLLNFASDGRLGRLDRRLSAIENMLKSQTYQVADSASRWKQIEYNERQGRLLREFRRTRGLEEL